MQFQEDLRLILKDLNERVKPSRDRTQELKRLTEQTPPNFSSHYFCLDPNVMIHKIEVPECRVFKSAMAPILLCFKAHTNRKENELIDYKVIFKNGDDLRQDQLIIQALNLINQVLKNINIDLKLSPYKVLACSKEDGFMEYVPNSKTIQEILKKSNNNLQAYLRQLAEEAVKNPKSWFH